MNDGHALALHVTTAGGRRQTVFSGHSDGSRFKRDGQRLISAILPVRVCVPAADWPPKLTFDAGGRRIRVVATARTVDGRRVLEFAMSAMASAAIR